MSLLRDSFIGYTRMQVKMPQENSLMSASGSKLTLPHLVHHHPRIHRHRLSDTLVP